MSEEPEDLVRVLHELHVHQAELEVQNHELRESREALEASRGRYADLFDFAPIGYMTIDTDGLVLEINLTGAAQLGPERSRIVGKPLRALVQLDEPDSMFVHLRSCSERRQMVTTELGFTRKKDQSHLYVQVVSTPVVDHEGEVTACRTAVVDITERKLAERAREEALERERAATRALEQARAAAEQASRLKDEFLGIVSHELRTPLNAILGWSHILSRRTDPAKVAHGLAVIRRNAEDQKRLVDDILDMSRIITGKLRAELKPMRIGRIVRAAVEAATPIANLKQVALVLDPHPQADPRVMADAERLQQVVGNLLSNALKFTPAGGRIDVTIETSGDVARVAVRDTGCGIDPSSMPWIFERFRQADSSSSRQYGGLGLGLAIVRHIAELHGGRVIGESEGAGRGATFVVELPVVGEEVGSSAPPPPQASVYDLEDRLGESLSQRLEGLHVLVVEDDDDARSLAATVLEHEGAEVSVAASVAEGLAALAQSAPQVLVSDLAMPVEDGLSFILKIRALPPPLGRVPAVAMTAHARAEDAKVALAAGYDEYLAKPVDPDALVLAVARVAELRS